MDIKNLHLTKLSLNGIKTILVIEESVQGVRLGLWILKQWFLFFDTSINREDVNQEFIEFLMRNLKSEKTPLIKTVRSEADVPCGSFMDELGKDIKRCFYSKKFIDVFKTVMEINNLPTIENVLRASLKIFGARVSSGDIFQKFPLDGEDEGRVIQISSTNVIWQKKKRQNV